MDKVSVVVPIYNVEKYLNKCIDSIINQTYKNLEIILVDDGSLDNCPKICDSYQKEDNRIKVIHKENGGLSDARNAGIEIATGKYICFIDSDDFISKEYIDTLYKMCIKHNADIAECDYIKFKDEKDIIEDEGILQEQEYTNIEMLNRLYVKNYSIKTTIAWNKLYKIDLFTEIRYPKGKLHEDEFTTYKLIYKSKKVVETDKKLYYYRQNDKSIMGKKFNEKRYDALEAFQKRKEFFKNKGNKDFYNKSDIKYQNKLINFYCLTKKYMKDSKQQQKKLLGLANENFNNMDRKIRYKVKFIFFKFFPNVYYNIWKIIRKKYNP